MIQFGPFTGGINTVDDARTLTGVDCVEALNLDIDNQGYAWLRPGYASVLAGNFLSGWNNAAGTVALAVEDTTLVLFIKSDDTYGKVVLRSDLISGVEMSFCEINQQVYYSNRHVIGYVENYASHDLATFTEVLADLKGNFLLEMQQVLQNRIAMKPGDIIRYYNTRLFTAVGGTITFSDPLAFYRTDRRRNFVQVPGMIILMEPVKDGIWLCWGDGIWFMSGDEPGSFMMNKMADYNAIEGTATRIEGGLVGEGLPGTVIKFATEKGICLATDGGTFQNLTISKYKMPSGALKGASFQRVSTKGFTQYISIIQS